MSASGLTSAPSRCYFRWPSYRLWTSHRHFQASPVLGKPYSQNPTRLLLERTSLASPTQRSKARRCDPIAHAMSASFGDMADDPTGSAVFPRINVRDPYKRLGISREASEDEIQAARNFLIQQYGGHKPSVDAIESAHDKIIMQKFYERRNPKIDIKKKVREVRQSKVVNFVFERFRTPSTALIIKTGVTFAVLGVLTVLFPTEEGPTLQVALSLVATLYFIHERLKSKLWAFLYGVGGFMVSWMLGTFLMVSVVPPFIKGLRGFEVMSSLITYIFLWIASTYLR